MVLVATRVPAELSEYRGKWVAIQGEDVVAAADSPAELLEIVRARELKDVSLHKVPEDADVNYVL